MESQITTLILSRRVLFIVASGFACTLLASSTPNTTLFIGAGVSVSATTGGAPMNAFAADVNGDGFLDIVTGTNFGPPYVYLNNGTATPFAGVTGHKVSTADTQQQVFVADMNGDGHPDILAAGFNSPTKLYLNNGTGDPFSGVTGTSVGSTSTDSTTALAVADINGDGYPDVAMANTNHYPSRVYLNNGTAQPFNGVTALNIGSDAAYAYDVQLADVNGDGRPDAIILFEKVIIGEPAGVFVYLDNGSSDPFGGVTPIKLLPGRSASRAAIVDVNHDGKPDLIASTYDSDGTFVFLNSGSSTTPFGSPTSMIQVPNLAGCGALTVVDVNNDLAPDILFACTTSSSESPELVVYINNGSSDPFSSVKPWIPNIPGPAFFSTMTVVDLTNNGTHELLVSGQLSLAYYPLILDQNPIAIDDAVSTTMNRFVEQDVLANDKDADGAIDRSAVAIVVTPLHGVARINSSTFTLIYQPDSGFTGTDSLQYTVKDNMGAGSNPGTMTIIVVGPPVANNDNVSTPANQAVVVNVLANDTNGPGATLGVSSLAISTAPLQGTAQINSDGTIGYQPRSGFSGPDIFQYTVKDNLGGTSNAATVMVTVMAPPPGAASSSGGGKLDFLSILALSSLALVRWIEGRKRMGI